MNAVEWRWTELRSPVGKLRLYADERAVKAVLWENDAEGRVRLPGSARPMAEAHPVLDLARRELERYFAGELERFSVEVAPEGTDFQRSAWRALREIPFGETRSYGEQARSLGDARKARAVGAANGRNPVSILIPCHRVIGANGALTGFAGGMEAKHWLLEHERRARARSQKRVPT